MTRRLPWLALLSFVPFASCVTSSAPDVGGVSVAMTDPSGLIDMVGGKLRVLVIPATTAMSGTAYACDTASGRLSPEPSTVDMDPIPDAVADVNVDVRSSAADAMISVPAGDYVILVRGRGTDRITGITNTVIASACAASSVTAGGTQSVGLTLIEVTGTGVCGDGTLSPDEQCDDHNTASGDGCSSSCETEAFDVNTAASCGGGGCTSQNPAVAWAPSGRAAVLFQRAGGGDPAGIRVRILSETGGTITSALALDQPFLRMGTDRVSPIQDLPAVAMSTTRIAGTFVDIVTGDFDACARFRDIDLMPPTDTETNLVEPAPAHSAPGAPYGRTGASMGSTQGAPTVAMLADGTTLFTFENSSATSGLSGRVYPAGASDPTAAPFNLGTSGGSQPSVAAVGGQFVVVYASGGDVHAQRVSPGGMTMAPTDVTTDPGNQDSPVIAALPTCPASGACAIVAWHDPAPAGDADGGIRARMLDGSGAPTGTAFNVNTSSAGDQTAPAAAAGSSRFVVGWQDAAGVHARNFDGAGMPALNRSRTPAASTNDYLLAPAGNLAPGVAVGGTANGLLVVWQTAAAGIKGRLIPLP